MKREINIYDKKEIVGFIANLKGILEIAENEYWNLEAIIEEIYSYLEQY